MATTLADLEKHRDRLPGVLGKGTRSYQMEDGRRLEYDSVDQVRLALAEIERRISAMGSGPLREVRISSSKGV